MNMTSTLNKTKSLLFVVLTTLAFLCQPAFAQNTERSQTLTVSPTLFEMQASRGQSWKSELRVINVNTYPITVYPQVVNFAPQGEDGRGTLIPVFREETSGQTLAEWIQVPTEGVLIPPQQTAYIEVGVTVPDEAPPGGHYAAILVGTKPPETETSSVVQTAQYVTSLFFVRVAGDVTEAGDIREFAAEKSLVQRPEVTLAMRFENTGNVHIQPQGDITIFNMFGQERGMIPINHQTHFGNVLPESIRKFTFTWKGETAFYDIGRYRAVATLGYGDDTTKYVTSTTYFWVFPYTIIGSILLALYVLVRIVIWLIRRYVERMISLSGASPHGVYQPRSARQLDAKTVVIGKPSVAAVAPVRVGAIELWQSWRLGLSLREKFVNVGLWLRAYKIFALSLLLVAIVIIGILTVVRGIMSKDTHYEVSINNPGADVVLSSEEIAYRERRLQMNIPEATVTTPNITVINRSTTVGAGAAAKLSLEAAGYEVDVLEVDPDENTARTTIVYSTRDAELALALSRLLKNALLSARESDTDEPIIVYAADDQLK
jgi:hypothetical protein